MGEKLEDKIDNYIAKNKPTGAAAKLSNLWLATCAATVAGGLYTGIVDWNPVVRAASHFTGAFALPAGGAFVSSLAMRGIEGIANLSINSYNKKHPETPKEQFKIDPKVKEVVNLLSAAAVGITYSWATLGTEADQYALSGILQPAQYAADVLGSAAGIMVFHHLDPKDALLSFSDKVWNLSKQIVKPLNALEDKFKGKNKDKEEINTPTSSSIAVEEIAFDPEISKSRNEDIPDWNVVLYNQHTQETTKEPSTSSDKIKSDDDRTL